MLHYILGDMEFNIFINKYLNKTSFLLKKSSRLPEEFSTIDFEQYLIAGEGNLQNLIRIIKDGDSIITVPSELNDSKTQHEFVIKQFNSGATLKLEELSSRNEFITKLCKVIEAEFYGICYAKAFLTNAQQKGLKVHFDIADVFVVQLEGTKRWRVWDKLVDLPVISMQKVLEEENLDIPIIDTILEPGDILYIPGGTPHAAECSNDYSLHMSFGLEPLKIHEVISGYFKILSEVDERLRQNIHPFSNKLELANLFRTSLEKTARENFNHILEDFFVAYNAGKHQNNNCRLYSIAQANKINNETKLFIRNDSGLKLKNTGDNLALYYSSTIAPKKPLILTPPYLQLPLYCKAELEYIIQNQGKVVNTSSMPGLLDEESKQLLCIELITLGIINVFRK